MADIISDPWLEFYSAALDMLIYTIKEYPRICTIPDWTFEPETLNGVTFGFGPISGGLIRYCLGNNNGYGMSGLSNSKSDMFHQLYQSIHAQVINRPV